MTDNAIVQGEFVTYSHVKTRKTFSITIEFPEEQALHVLNTLGSPIGGNSKPVAVALLHSQINPPKEQTAGDRIRTRAVLLCKDDLFQAYLGDTHLSHLGLPITEEAASAYLKQWCEIDSRSELATSEAAQESFIELADGYLTWKYEKQYSTNLDRV